MLKKLITALFALLGLGLPLHGGITVFLPDLFRWWKEGVLLLLAICLCVMVWQQRGKLWNRCKKLSRQQIWTSPVTYAVLFLGWIEFLVWINPEFVRSLIAARYLALGFIVFLLVWSFGQVFKSSFTEKLFHKFTSAFLAGSLISIVFGVWAQFLGGFNQLTNWYSNTISSWVPGQTLPLYHQTSEGLVRMQGLSSGPIEFSHLLIVSLWVSCQARFGVWRMVLIPVILSGIWFSASRAALLGAIIILGWYAAVYLYERIEASKFPLPVLDSNWIVNVLLVIILAMAGLGGLKYVVLELPESQLQKVVRLSDSDHITRPIAAFKMGLDSPVVGNLGKLGPAARAYNLKNKNIDQAPISENVFIDYFAQLGLIGVVLSLFFWFFWIIRSNTKFVLIGSAFVILGNLATILDMTPVSIAWFMVLGFAIVLPVSKK